MIELFRQSPLAIQISTYKLSQVNSPNQKDNWPTTSRVHNAYCLTYIREDMVQELLSPATPPESLVARVEREQEDRKRARMEHEQRVQINVVLEKDLLARKPFGFWDLCEGGIELTLPPME